MNQKILHIPKKSFGQNFLNNKDICKKIVDLLGDISCKNVLEIGPGQGALTNFIHDKPFNSFTVIEKDTDLILTLKEKFVKAKILNQDGLKVKLKDVLAGVLGVKNEASSVSEGKLLIIGNLPYNVGTLMILNWVLECDIIEKIVVMLQKEVAVRFASKENSKEYGIPSVLLQRYFDIKVKINVSPNNFFPKPNVDSAVLLFERNKTVFDLEEFLFVQKFVSTLFQSRRKKIKSSVVKIIENYGANSDAILTALSEKEIEVLDKRIEALSVGEIFSFANRIKSLMV